MAARTPADVPVGVLGHAYLGERAAGLHGLEFGFSMSEAIVPAIMAIVMFLIEILRFLIYGCLPIDIPDAHPFSGAYKC